MATEKSSKKNIDRGKTQTRGAQKSGIEKHRKPDIKELIQRYEFYRNGMAVLPSPEDRKPGVAFFIRGINGDVDTRFCTCTISRKKTCSHILDLMNVYKAVIDNPEGKGPDEDFRAGIWFRIASVLGEGSSPLKKDVLIRTQSGKTGSITVFSDSKKRELVRYFSPNADLSRFLERCIELPEEGENYIPNRNYLLKKLVSLTTKENEWFLLARGFKTRGQAIEESFWFILAYHGYREFGNNGFSFHPAVSKRSGSFTVTCRDSADNPVFRMIIPRNRVRRFLFSLNKYLPNQHSMPIHPVPLKSIFNVNVNTELDLEVRPLIKLIQEDGEEKFFKREELERFQYDDLVYIPELGIMAELERPGKERKFHAPVKMVLKKAQVPEILDKYGDEILCDDNIISPEVKALNIIKDYDRIDIDPGILDRDWCWLSVKYGFGSSSLLLQDILRAREEGQKYLATVSGWVDIQSSRFKEISDVFKEVDLKSGKDQIKFSRLDLLRLAVSGPNILNIRDNANESAEILKRIVELRPSRPFKKAKGLKSELRAYQKLGVEWISFLYENGFGGLLCDDMGLGKTHQIMAFLLFLRESYNVKAPFLVVCPTTVLSHWKDKVDEHAPSLKAIVYHGGGRDLKTSLSKGKMLLTSYGVMLRDMDKLSKTRFSVAVFDEIQHIKNPETRAYEASLNIDAKMKIGLTGTPIENRLEELKALFDLTVPGYMGTDANFIERYSHPIQDLNDNKRRHELGRLISPFILRRLKKSVLSELPEKIEDTMGCSLSDDQLKLYRDAIKSRGSQLLDKLKKGGEPIPYIHIFALLNLLKQICDHPALVEKAPEKYEEYQSGKWDLFKEILGESLGSGQKVVVYSQYLDMIRIIENHLNKEGVTFVSLTGASRNRGDILKRFRDDPACSAFIGSLRAGGVGIDLIAASVVIHYDRWWNAAKEDQATDRVHRIGQTRGVQVFKLVTRGTLEEKIAAIIDKKKNLMDSVIKEDDPGLLKGFSREELIELIEL